MWKINFILLFSSIMLPFCSKIYAQTDSITLSGTLNGLGSHMVSISFTGIDGKNNSYRSVAQNDRFSFKIPLQKTPVSARFNVGINRSPSANVNGSSVGNPAPPLDLFIFDKDITLTGDAMLVQFASVQGDEENNAFNQYKEAVKEDEQKGYEMMQTLFANTYSGKPLQQDVKTLQNEAAAVRKQVVKYQKAFINTHPKAFATIFLLSRMQNLYTATEYTKIWNSLPDRYKDHPQAKGIRSYIEKMKGSLTGMPAIAFDRTDKDGKQISLSAFKGKTILLDFWGSWCGPCRASHPHLKELYKKYKGKGFEIIAIAHERGKTLDESKVSWLKAIKEDGINWVHILNQDGIEKQDIVKSYQISAFPTKILVDKDGKIILRITASATDDIDKALEKIYGY